MVNNRIKSRRTELKMTAKQLSEKTGLTPAYISQLENGKRENPSTDVMDKIANALCTTIDYLLNKTDDKEQEKTEQLSPKAERDIQKSLNETLNVLENSQDALMFDGEPLDDETRELLKSSLENSMRLAKKIAKEKYTPKKYKK